LNAEVCPDLDAVVMRALHEDPRDRFPDVEAFAAAIRGVEDAPREKLSVAHARMTARHDRTQLSRRLRALTARKLMERL
jgi:hypothetical protein